MAEEPIDEKKLMSEIDSIDNIAFARIESRCFPQWGRMVKEQNELYYYTDLNALINGILNRKKDVCLWATRWSHLNDPEEILLEYQNLNFSPTLNWFKESLFNKVHKNHSVSFSYYGDNLPMWKMYGDGGNGVMLIFDTKELVKKYGGYLQPCIYKGTEEYKRTEKKIFNPDSHPELKEMTIAQQQFIMIRMLQMFVSITKSDDYLYEKEARLIGLGNPHFGHECNQKYRLLGNNIIPYVEAHLPKESLKGVCLGPLANSTLNKEILKEFLASKGYDNIGVTISKIRYR